MTHSADDLQQLARDHLWGHFSRLTPGVDGVTVIERGEGCYVWDDQRQALPRRAGRAVHGAGRATAARRLAEAAAQQAEQARPTSRSGPTPTRPPSSWPPGWPQLRPGRPQPGVLHHRRRRGGRVGLEAGPPVLRGHRPARAREGDQPRDLAYHGTTHRGAVASPASTAIKDAVPAAAARRGRHVANTNRYRCRTARRRPTDTLGVRRRHRGDDHRARAPRPSPPCTSSRCRTPAAASSRPTGLLRSGCGRSATATACCWCPTR